MNTIRELLERAVAAGAAVSLVYSGGSRPGLARTVVPLALFKEKLSARDETSRVAKSFSMEKIASVTWGESVAVNASTPVNVSPVLPVLSGLRDYIALLSNDYIACGWHIISDDQRFGVRGFAKNGSARKTPCVLIEFVDRSVTEEFDPSTGEFILAKRHLTGREKPWRVSSRLLPSAKAYSELSSAMEAFAAEVRGSTPKPA